MQKVIEPELDAKPTVSIAGAALRADCPTASTQTASAAISAGSAELKPARRLRRLSRLRKLVGFGLLLLPALAVLVSDAARRGERLVTFQGFYRLTYLAAFAESVILWSALLYAASRRRGVMRWVTALLFVVAGTFAFGGQQYFYQQYHAYLNVDVSLFASNFMDSVINQLFADIGNYLMAKIPPLVAAVALVWIGRLVIRPKRRPALVFGAVAPLLLVASFFIPTQNRHLQAATPDVLYLQAVGGLIRTQVGMTEQSNQLRPRVRQSLPVPPLASKVDRPRNVLFLILESVRSDAVCVEYDANCKHTPYSNVLVPERFPFTQMRSMDSSTAISLAVLWEGVGPHESRDVLHTWPVLFDYARAAGWDTAFWTSQNMMFGNARLWVKNLAVSSFVSATDLDSSCDLDMGAPEAKLAAHVNHEIDKLKEPFLAVVQFSNVHYPYWLEEDGPQPFQPATTSKAPDVNGSFFNYYLNAVHQQDRHVASIIGHLRATERGKHTVIVYTSDHAEAFREHHQMGHTFSIFDEEIKVPAWIDAPPGILSEAQKQSLVTKKDEFNFHVDIAPTILDLMGVLDEPAIAQYRTKMLGTSLLRPGVTTGPLPLTNCAGVWSCAFENWGYMQKTRKLEGRSWNEGWQCFDLSTDPYELDNLGHAACADLEQLASRTFGRMPGVK